MDEFQCYVGFKNNSTSERSGSFRYGYVEKLFLMGGTRE